MQTGLNIALVKLTRKMLCYLRSTVKIFKRKSAIDLGEPELQHKTSKRETFLCPVQFHCLLFSLQKQLSGDS